MSYNLYNKETKELSQIAGNGIGVAKFGSKQSGEIWGKTSSSPWKAPIGGIYVRRFGDRVSLNQRIIDKTDNINYTMYFDGNGSDQRTVLTIPIIQGHEYYDNSDNWGSHTDVFYPFVENVIQPIEGGIEYSTTEKVIGTWTDGKPLYQKSFFYEASYVEGWNNMDNISVLNIDSLASLDANAHVTLGGGGWYKAPYVSRDNPINGFDVRLSGPDGTNQKSLLQVYKKGTALDTISVTIKYTKTTD